MQCMQTCLRLCSIALLSLLAMLRAAVADMPSSDTPEQLAVRQEFIAAMQRVRQHAAEAPDSPALQAYSIYPYLVAARLRRDLAAAPSEDLDAKINAFALEHGKEPVARNLRHDWLLSLAERQRWDWFLPRALNATDPTLICERLAGRLATRDTAGLGTEALALWLAPQRQPRECDGVFGWLRAQGLLTAALAESRTRAALAAGNVRLAREAVIDVPAARAAPLQQWIQLLESPKPTLLALATNAATAVEPDALAAGFTRLSRADATSGLMLLPLLLARPDMTPALQVQLQRAAALGAAYDRNPSAVTAFSAIPQSALDNEVYEWRARAALWAGEFATALDWIDQMPPGLATQPRWRYWHARALEATSGADAAAPLFAELAGLRDFYGYLAADRVHRDYSLNVRPTLDDAAAQAALAAQSGLSRAHELFACDMIDEANLEWTDILADADAATKVQAAHLAARWGWHTQAITTLAQAGEWDDLRLRYPRPFVAEIEQASALTQVPSGWLWAVMRQESLFRKDATSPADARGLMQILPSTATAVARRWHMPRPEHASLFDPSVAIALGAAYLREMLDRYASQLGPSLAAYNAGPLAVARWLPDKSMDADIWIENIPYAETRGYVQHILEHIVAYAWANNTEPPRLARLLPPVAPTASGPPAIPVTSIKASSLVDPNRAATRQ
jgi:soluble lytic murein transglycosylase